MLCLDANRIHFLFESQAYPYLNEYNFVEDVILCIHQQSVPIQYSHVNAY